MLAVFPSGRAIEGIGLCDHLIVELKVELVGKVSLVDHDLLAFVGDEKLGESGDGECRTVERCNPILALGACASELLILRPLVVNNVAVCFGGLFLGGLFFDGSFVFFEGHESILAEIQGKHKD